MILTLHDMDFAIRHAKKSGPENLIIYTQNVCRYLGIPKSVVDKVLVKSHEWEEDEEKKSVSYFDILSLIQDLHISALNEFDKPGFNNKMSVLLTTQTPFNSGFNRKESITNS